MNMIEQIKNGIIRIRSECCDSLSLCERYGILNAAKHEITEKIDFGENWIKTPFGRTLNYCVRPEEDNEEWKAISDYLSKKFEDKKLNYKVIEGNPNEKKEASDESIINLNQNAGFGISISIEENERFYGLGEGGHNKIELRGGCYQNFAMYQFDEIPIPLVISSEGWGVLINAAGRHFVDIGEQKKDQLIVCGEDDALDVFILCGHTMADVLKLYTELTGAPMLLPKWAYGLTYIANINSNQFDIMNDAKKFRDLHIPCDMISLEPNWMDKFYDFSTEKKWDLTKFHMPSWLRSRNKPETFISALRRYGFHLSLWLCIDYDLTAEAERQYKGEETCSLEPWYEHLKAFVNDGADGFKLDPASMLDTNHPDMVCANGISQIKMHNLNQVLLPKQMYEGFAAQMNARPMHHYCGGYMGIQRWSAANTGDNGGELGTMVWLETLALSGHMNTTIDMNIYYPESIHFGMFAPWAHINAWSGCRQPWWAGDEMQKIFTEYARLRYRLIPYIYSTAIEGHETAMPIIRPMPLAFPSEEATMDCIYQYMFGPSLLVTAYTDKVILPEGVWVDYWTNEEYAGPAEIEKYIPPQGKGGGLFVKKGAIIPTWKDRDYISQYSDEEIMLDLYPYGESSYIFREDDGYSLDYENSRSCHTLITCREDGNTVRITIGNREGDYQNKPEKRKWIVRVHGTEKNVEVECHESIQVSCEVEYV